MVVAPLPTELGPPQQRGARESQVYRLVFATLG